MSDIDKDSRVLSLANKPGLRQSLVTLLDQLGRCQKALNEFLEVTILLTCFYHYVLHMQSLVFFFAGEASSVPKVLFPRR